MTDDIVQRLRAYANDQELEFVDDALVDEAADEIERLRAENAFLRERNRQAIRAAMGAYERHVSTAPEQENDR